MVRGDILQSIFKNAILITVSDYLLLYKCECMITYYLYATHLGHGMQPDHRRGSGISLASQGIRKVTNWFI